MRPAIFAIVAIAAFPAWGQGDHDHLSEVGGLRVVHAWAPATSGREALLFMEIENHAERPHILQGGEAEWGQSLDLVGFTYSGGEQVWEVLPGMPVEPGHHLELAPRVLALRLQDLERPLVQGEVFSAELFLGDLHVPVQVDVEPGGATAHSHAGHAH